jgi:DNA (cytosine-5)-methyltransferase 1
MLWEVERILTECHELGNLPQVLLMENVPQVHSQDNIADFHKWQLRLEELGYSNYMQDLIATDYGIPQTRNRCFMVSILGEYSYTFPQPIPLKLKLKDILEDEVNEKYYLSNKMLEYITSKDDKYQVNENKLVINRDIACSKTTREGNTRADTTEKIKNATKQGYLEAEEGDGINLSSRMEYQRGNVQKQMIQTIDTMGGESKGVVVKDKSLYTETEKALFTKDGNIKRYLDSDIIDKFEEGQMATTTFPNGYGHGPRTHNESVALNTIDKPSVKHNLRIRKLTPKECFRLMGVKDEDFERCAKNQSDSSLYHLAGDSIVVNVLMAIFGEML